MSVKEHYDTHLGNFYEWMVGDFVEKQAAEEAFFVSQGIGAKGNQIALDLGAGHGLHSISLSNLGYQVKAVDFNQQLLDSLRDRASNRSIEIIDSDILNYLKEPQKADLVLCMGDTLAHLSDFEELQKFIMRVHEVLNPGGFFISSFRDYEFELEGTQRFIPVKSDHSRILTCFLEYEKESVRVTDQLYEKENDTWNQKLSSYKKLRIGVEKVQKMMLNAGFDFVSLTSIRRMNYLVVKK